MALILFPKLALGPVGIRDRRRRHAAGARRRQRHRGPARWDGSATPRSCCSTAALIMSVMLMASSFITAVLIPAGGVRAGRARGRPGARLPRARAPGHGVRHGLRPVDDRDSVVRRLVGDGRAADAGAAISAPLRHGAGMGAARIVRWSRSSSASPSSSASRSTPASKRRAARTRPACWC